MIPGLGFLYSGLARRKSALSMIWACMGSFSVITFQWYFWGYSLAFSAQGTSGFIGDLKHFGLMNTLGAPSPGSPLIPELLYSFYQVHVHYRYRKDCGLTLHSDAILCYYCRYRCRGGRGARSFVADDGISFLLGHSRLLPNSVLGMEHQRMGLQVRRYGLRRWRAGRDRLRNVCSGLFNGPRETSRKDDDQLPSPQCLADRPRDHFPLVRLAWFQRRVFFWRQSPSGDGLLELELDCHVCRCNLDDSRLETCEKVVDGRLVLRGHLWTRSGDPGVRIHYSLGIRRFGCRDRNRVQLCNQRLVERPITSYGSG